MVTMVLIIGGGGGGGVLLGEGNFPGFPYLGVSLVAHDSANAFFKRFLLQCS